jgi:sporulation integral membrane protein YlbJ
MKKSIGGILSVLCLLMLLFNPGLALEGARQGLVLWGNVVLPTLLPFMICSGVIVAMDAIHILTGPFKPILSGILALSDQGSFCLMSGLLCGYPMGAKTTSDFLDQGRLSPREGKYLLAISNHPSPMFVLGYVMAQIALIPSMVRPCPLWAVLAALYLPILPISLLARCCYHYKRQPRRKACLEAARTARSEPDTGDCFSFDTHMMSCFETMVKIGGYIMLFSILALYLTVFPFQMPPLLRPALLGSVEITTGIQIIASSVPGKMGALLIIGSAAFGGFSGIFQTKSVLKNAGLSIRHYMLWKLLHSALSCLIFYVALCRR